MMRVRSVKAALEGRILVLDGIEKAERNVLPVLNNLLENREMHLEDGRFLIPAERYDKLVKEHGEDEVKRWNLARVSENFRVIALGLPVPGYLGNPLDPPLRSRFQARDIPPPTYQDLSSALQSAFPTAPRDKVQNLLSCAYALISPEASTLGLPDFPLENIPRVIKLMELYPWLNVQDALGRLYPKDYMLNSEGVKSLDSILDTFRITPKTIGTKLSSIQCSASSATVKMGSKGLEASVQVPCGVLPSTDLDNFVKTPYQEDFLAELIQSHSVGDICVVGPRGCGKSSVVRRLASLLGYSCEPIVLYQDMTSRDLIQQRATHENGDTYWKNSPLINAALEGKMAVLDGLHRVHPSTVSILHRLVHDREIQLHDGTRLIRKDRYDKLAQVCGESTLKKNRVFPVHPSFRIVALAEPNALNSAPWLTPEMLSLFIYHEMKPLSKEEESHIISSMFKDIPRAVWSVMEISHTLRKAKDPILLSIASSLSTRQLLRIARRCKYNKDIDPHSIINRACMSKFLPPLAKQTLDTVLLRAGIVESEENAGKLKTVKYEGSELTIGDTVAQINQTSATSKVPDILFYDVPQHIGLLERMLQDFLLKEHLLLVGNQGVGKNKLVDKLLQLLNCPREYIQLHRDTTVQSLTLQPTVKGGIVLYEDSPLVIAIKNGYVLVVDEADKAPTHVTCILKTLVENGEMILSDGRRIVPQDDPRVALGVAGIIPMHPDFRMIVLANRPGFPFLGNDFFGELGDLFSCHAVDNPSRDSELVLLRKYGPDVPLDIIDKLVGAFGRLRSMADQGLVTYPYSTRELVNIVKHLQKFPEDDISNAVSNVFDFDRYSKEAREVLFEVLSDYKIPIAMTQEEKVKGRKKIQMTIERDSGKDMSGPKFGKVDDKNEPHVGGNTWAGGTGGRDTAGLGGKGGPFRLDAGHDVHQISDAEKAAVPEHIRKAAREMGLKAFKAKLEEIKMSEYDASLYEQFSNAVAKQVQAMRVLLGNLQSKSKERQWQKHQTSGELDDTKLIEGVTGERAIYKKRTDNQPEIGAPQMKPKRLKLVVDVSGSMYRFNGYDGRLERQLEAVVMVMESFEGYDTKIQYDIVGHSGEARSIKFVDKANPPKNNKQRLESIRTMHAHSQFCMAGDYTVEAVEDAVKSLAKENCDEGVVVILSDANLSRYAIQPKELSQAMSCDNRVEAFVIFIGSLGDEAVRLVSSLPAGKAFTCMDLSNLPHILQTIFTTSMLKSN
ncbi:hypothetical protein GE061_016641 [Apolygus lucorum]|uniref:VWFA domain-containing protein n=1 Tax=Apolygus lucorum TaxID=248454 RepID=A0A8S9XHX6_APOLU|nr:hypothetical protein GE061_016641 [Apolygus lucorum]